MFGIDVTFVKKFCQVSIEVDKLHIRHCLPFNFDPRHTLRSKLHAEYVIVSGDNTVSEKSFDSNVIQLINLQVYLAKSSWKLLSNFSLLNHCLLKLL